MSEMNREVEMETTETIEEPTYGYAEDVNNTYQSEPVYGYDQTPDYTVDPRTVAKYFTYGATAGAGATMLVTKLVNTVKGKIAEKKGDQPKEAFITKFRLQLPWRFDKIPVETKAAPAENSAETPVEETETK